MSQLATTHSGSDRRVSLVAWAELAVCLAPVTAGWVYGTIAAVWLALSASLRGPSGVLLIALLIIVGLACAAFGIVALWSLVLPRALGRPIVHAPRAWQLAGLAAGFLGGSVGIVLVLAGTLNGPARLVWAYLFASPIVVATHAAVGFAVRGIPDSEPS